MTNHDSELASSGADLIETAMFLVPPTPTTAIEVGATWTARRVLPLGSNVPDVETEINITSSADTGDRTETVRGQPAHFRNTLNGESELRLGGALVRSRARMTVFVVTGAITLDLVGDVSGQRVSTSAR